MTDDERAEFEAARAAGLKARHETRVERAIRRQVAEEIAEAIEAVEKSLSLRGRTEIERGFAAAAKRFAAVAREIGGIA